MHGTDYYQSDITPEKVASFGGQKYKPMEGETSIKFYGQTKWIAPKSSVFIDCHMPPSNITELQYLKHCHFPRMTVEKSDLIPQGVCTSEARCLMRWDD